MIPQKHKRLFWLNTALLAICLNGCGETPERSLIKSGYYELQGYAHRDTKLGMTLTIDRDARTATFSFPDGTSRALAWTTKPEPRWETGCWADDSDYHTEMEVALLDAATLALEVVALKNPRLVAGCPEGVDHLSLAEEEGHISSGPLGAIEPHSCEIESTCFLFARATR